MNIHVSFIFYKQLIRLHSIQNDHNMKERNDVKGNNRDLLNQQEITLEFQWCELQDEPQKMNRKSSFSTESKTRLSFYFLKDNGKYDTIIL